MVVFFSRNKILLMAEILHHPRLVWNLCKSWEKTTNLNLVRRIFWSIKHQPIWSLGIFPCVTTPEKYRMLETMGIPSIHASPDLRQKWRKQCGNQRRFSTGERLFLDFLGGAFLEPLCSMCMAYLPTVYIWGSFGRKCRYSKYTRHWAPGQIIATKPLVGYSGWSWL